MFKMGMFKFGADDEMGSSAAGSGSMWLRSKKDPRWNVTIRVDSLVFSTNTDLDWEIARLKDLYGEPPDDLEMGGMKD